MDQLPIDILMKIFSFLNRYEEVSLVSKKFYNVACKVNDPNICLRVDETFSELELLTSIRSSQRKITKITCGKVRPSTIIPILKQFSASIKYFKLDSYAPLAVTMSEFLDILSLIPNVEHLTLHNLALRPEENQESNDKFSCSDDLNLHQLKTLRLCVSDAFITVFQRLPEGVLTEFMLSESDLDASVVLFKRQANIKKLLLFYISFKAVNSVDDMFENLKLESFTLYCCQKGIVTLTQSLSKQTKLKEMLLGIVEVNERFLNLVANRFTELESFSMHHCFGLGTASIASISKISNLKTMKNVSLWLIHAEHRSLVEYHNPGITNLSVQISGLDLYALSKSVPNLKVLKFYESRHHQQLNAIMEIFNFIEVLEITVNSNSHITEGDFYNPKLTELKIEFECNVETSVLDKFIASYPNLKKLELDKYPITASQFRRILDGYANLDSLKLGEGVCDLTIDDLNYLKYHGNNLKNIYLGRFYLVTFKLDELKRQFYAIFGVIIYNGYNLRMAIDRNILNKTWCNR